MTSFDEALRRTDTNSINATAEVKRALSDMGIDADELGDIQRVWVKTKTGEDGGQQLAGYSFFVSPKWADGPAWTPVQPAAPVTVRVPKARAHKRDDGWKVAVIHPDPQFGYRKLNDGTLDPFHDDRALDVALQITEHVRPDVAVLLGDTLDLPELGRFRTEPSMVGTIQATLDRAHRYIATVAALAGETVMMQGNHDLRLQNYVMDNAAAAFGIKPANIPDAWPSMSVRSLLRLDELGVQYVDGYPAGRRYLTPTLRILHGSKVKSGGSTAAAMVKESVCTEVFGHVHVAQLHHRTLEDHHDGASVQRHIFAYSPGCLCRIDGAVPGTTSGIDEAGRPVWSNTGWQQGVGVLHYHDAHDPWVEHVPIANGAAWYRGSHFIAD